MKTFTTLKESCLTSDVNPGNSLDLGVANHLTPINNILTNIRNLYSDVDIVAAVAEDGVSIKLHSSRFVNRQECDKILNYGNIHRPSLHDYLVSQGLDFMKFIQLGQYWVVYFSPSDIKAAVPGLEAEPATEPDPENTVSMPVMKVEKKSDDESELTYCEAADMELLNLILEADDDKDIKEITHEKILSLIKEDDKVKAAKQFELLVAQEIELPREFYFAGVESSNTKEQSIALRWKYTKRAAHNQTIEMVKTLINIYNVGKDGVFVPDYDKKSMFKLPSEVKTLIDHILEFIGAEKTSDECVYSIKEEDKKDEKEKSDSDEKKDDSSDKKDDSSSDSKDDGDLLGGDSGSDKKDDSDSLL